MIEPFVWLSAIGVLIPACVYISNLGRFRVPPLFTFDTPPCVSVLIPARNEEDSIGQCLESVLQCDSVTLEVIVLDDASTDATAAIVAEVAHRDARVKLVTAPPLPAGWSGKQHACHVLSRHAKGEYLAFIDADVRLQPDALVRLVSFQQQSQAELVSGFPRQDTGTILERLLIPLMHFILLSYLPLRAMRRWNWPAFGAGCGQIFLTRREAYDAVGGHAAVKTSFHDGVKLPRAYRAIGLGTDICDATTIASCRMYRNAGQVWNGLAKNAREGMASRIGIWVWTAMLIAGQILPIGLLAQVFTDTANSVNVELKPILTTVRERWCIVALVLAPLLIRLHAAWRFRQSWLSALLHPLGILLLLSIQWYAVVCSWRGRPMDWKGRTQPS